MKKIFFWLPFLCSFLLFFTKPLFSQPSTTASQDSKAVVLSDGKKVWPPQGPGCESFVRCCGAAEKLDSTASLMCQLTVSVTPVDCVKGMKDFRQYLVERKVKEPQECSSAPAK
ncbi:MAG: hypothetical protein HQM15_05820 [Deltaproteobacteria bacterium]|nr:hypothetical protein [Deltaproteobacteria bacterium]